MVAKSKLFWIGLVLYAANFFLIAVSMGDDSAPGYQCAWILLRDQIEYNEFCRRGQQQQKSSDACAGMPETPYGATSHRPVD